MMMPSNHRTGVERIRKNRPSWNKSEPEAV
jgi:hypothetical protein